MRSALARPVLASAALAFASSSVTHADVETAVFFNEQLFSYKVKHMPDIDQYRKAAPGILGLPLDGSMHCAPTSALNLMIYAANHGFPTVWPGPGDYQHDLYNVATLNDLTLGITMGTDEGGTGGNALFDGTKAWVDQSAPGRFTVSCYAASGTYSPRLTDLAKTAIEGGIVAVCYGRYKVIGTYDGYDLVSRSLGHCVTLSRALRNGDDQLIGLRDPADANDSWTTQSPFGTRECEVLDRTVAADTLASEIRTMSALNYDAAKEKNAYIDRYVSIQPKQGYCWQPSPLTLTSVFKVIQVGVFSGGHGSTGEQAFNLSGTLLDAAISPDHTSVVLLIAPKSGGPTELHDLGLLDGKLDKIGTVPGARSLQFSRHRRLYVAAPNLISMFDLTTKKPLGSVEPPLPVEAITCDDRKDEVLMLCSDAKKLLRWKEGLGGSPTILDLSGAVMGGSSTITVDLTDGDVFFATEKSPAMYVLPLGGTPQPLLLPGASFPTALDLDDVGHLFAVSGGKVNEFAFDATSGWKVVQDSPFAGMSVGADFHVTRSRHNLTSKHAGKEWDDVDPTQLAGLIEANFLPDCDAGPTNLEYGAGKAGGFGVPHLAALDAPTLGMPTAIELSHARPGALPVLLLGTQSAALPFDGGLLHLVPTFVFPITVPIGVDGKLTLPGELPGDASLCGVTLYHQMLFVDPGAPGYYHTAITNGLARTFGS